jgi:hypothetical protein
MKEYSIDIGSWERGRVHRLYARSPEQAYDVASRMCIIPSSNDEIVQIHEIVNGRKKCVYDCMNGFEFYQGREDEPSEVLQ